MSEVKLGGVLPYLYLLKFAYSKHEFVVLIKFSYHLPIHVNFASRYNVLKMYELVDTCKLKAVR